MLKSSTCANPSSCTLHEAPGHGPPYRFREPLTCVLVLPDAWSHRPRTQKTSTSTFPESTESPWSICAGLVPLASRPIGLVSISGGSADPGLRVQIGAPVLP